MAYFTRGDGYIITKGQGHFLSHSMLAQNRVSSILYGSHCNQTGSCDILPCVNPALGDYAPLKASFIKMCQTQFYMRVLFHDILHAPENMSTVRYYIDSIEI